MLIEEIGSGHGRTTTEESEGTRGLLLGPATAPVAGVHHGSDASCLSTMDNLVDMFFEDSSSDDDDDLDMLTLLLVDYARKKKRKRRGSIVGRDVVRRPQQSGHDKLFRDYFCENPIYGHRFFRRRFRMSRRLFIRIENAVGEHCPYFV